MPIFLVSYNIAKNSEISLIVRQTTCRIEAVGKDLT